MDDVVDALKDIISKQSGEEKPVPLLPKGYTSLPFDKKYLIDAFARKNYSSYTYVDSGYQEILGSSQFSLSFLRVCSCTYCGKEKKDTSLSEFYILTTTSDGRLFSCKVFPVKGSLKLPQSLTFDSYDDSLTTGGHQLAISSVAGVVRRLAELRLCLSLVDSLNEGDVLVLDGRLQAETASERELLESLKNSSQEKGVAVVGLAKSQRIFTQKGNLFSSFLLRQSFCDAWLYSPLGESVHLPVMSFVKLHRNSSHTFLLETFDKPALSIVEGMIEQCADPVFVGYPYGLVAVDHMARVSNKEAEYLKTKLLSQKGIATGLKHSLNSQNAHSLLDSISF